MNEEGDIITDPKLILSKQEKFYSNLYKYRDVEYHRDYLKGLDSPKLSYGPFPPKPLSIG